MTKILLIEDDKIYAQLVQDVLTQHNYEVTITPTVMEGLLFAEQQPPDVIIVDLALPSIDGITAIEMFRQRPLFSQTPIIVATAIGAVELQRRAWAAGCNAFLLKPFQIERLLEIIQQYDHSSP